MIDFLRNFKINSEDELWINVLKILANTTLLSYVLFIFIIIIFFVRGWLGIGLKSMFNGTEALVVKEIPIKGMGEIQIQIERERLSCKARQKKGNSPIKKNDKITIVGFKRGSYIVQALQKEAKNSD